MNKRREGKAQEDFVANYLAQKGYSILEKNFTIQGGEIDLITKLNRQIVFVEVKSLKSEQYIKLEQTVSTRKKYLLIRACQFWLVKHNLQSTDWRIDFVGIVTDGKRIHRLLHLENAIY